jgi:hypothetical protein
MKEYRYQQGVNEAKTTQILETNTEMLKEMRQDNKINRELLQAHIINTNNGFDTQKADFSNELKGMKIECLNADREQDLKALERKANWLDKIKNKIFDKAFEIIFGLVTLGALAWIGKVVAEAVSVMPK